MKVMIIDDDTIFANEFIKIVKVNLDKILSKYFLTCINEHFKEANYNNIDLCFVDIDLKEVSGISIARKIKAINPNVILIFVSSREDLVFNTFEVRPFQFIRKANLSDDITLTFNLLDDYLQKLSYFVVFNINGRKTNILLRDILYIEAFGHNISIITTNDEITFRGTMKEVLEQINSKDIIQIQRSFSVNLRNVKEINKNIITLITNHELEIGRKYKQDVINSYREFLIR